MIELELSDTEKDILFHKNHPRFFETHYILICPLCMLKCHTLYLIGKYPDDELGCRKCVVLLEEK